METLTFRSKYDYSPSATGIEVPVSLTVADGRPVRLFAKVDTGAAFCIFQRDYAEQLGIDVESGVHAVVSTPTGGRLDVYGHTLTLSCLDWEFETMVYFAALPEYPRNVLGRSGWLQRFRLGLIEHDALLFLSQYDD
ncbi:MAG: retropepsin-like aspartic protease [Bryobacteraceae bacterium]